MPSLKCVLTRALLRGDAPNLVPIELGEPQVAIRPGRDAQWLAAKFVPTPRGQGERGETAADGDAPDAVPKGQGEPQVAIRPGGNPPWPASRDVELSDEARSGDAPNVANIEFRKPEVAIRPGGDLLGLAAIRGPTVLLW